MNDEINKMMRQKHHWEVRIRELGGDVLKGIHIMPYYNFPTITIVYIHVLYMLVL